MKCLGPECENLAVQRGLCDACYIHARQFVYAGATTWNKLIKNGKALQKLSDQPKSKCLNPKCDKPCRARGLCECCYVFANRAVKDGKATWDALILAGKALPAKTARRADGVNRQWFLGEQ